MKKSGKQPKEQPEMPSEGRSYVIVDGKKELHPEEETMQMNRRLLFKSVRYGEILFDTSLAS